MESNASSRKRKFDFSLFHENQDFSDCTLRLLISHSAPEKGLAASPCSSLNEPGRSQGASGAAVCKSEAAKGSPVLARSKKEMMASSAILSAQSSYFWKLFTSEFREKKERVVEIPLAAEEEEAFMYLLDFMYTRPLPMDLSFGSKLSLLYMADRFGVMDCCQAAVEMLSENVTTLSPEEWVTVLSIPELLKGIAGMSSLLKTARDLVLKHYSPLLAKPGTESLLELPEEIMTVLMATPEMTESDMRALSGLIWVLHNSCSLQDRASKISRIVLPFIKLSTIHPTLTRLIFMATLGMQLPKAELRFILQKVLGAKRSVALMIMTFCGRDSLATASKPLVDLTEAVMDLAHNNCISSGSLLKCQKFQGILGESLSDSSTWSSLEGNPTRQIFLDVDLPVCKDWATYHTLKEDLAVSQSIFVCGWWARAHAYVKTTGASKCIVRLKLDPEAPFKDSFVPRAQESRAKEAPDMSIHWQVCILTSATKPFYQKIAGMYTLDLASTSSHANSVLNLAFPELLSSEARYFPDGVLQLRVDLWAKEADALRAPEAVLS